MSILRRMSLTNHPAEYAVDAGQKLITRTGFTLIIKMALKNK